MTVSVTKASENVNYSWLYNAHLRLIVHCQTANRSVDPGRRVSSRAKYPCITGTRIFSRP